MSSRYLLLSILAVVVADARAEPMVPSGLPVFKHHSIVLDYQDLKYNPYNDVIIPSVIRTEHLDKPLGKFYLYYAPHNAPGGICLAYADRLEGPWKEYDANPIIRREWSPHYKVSHVSGPEAIWIEEERRLFLYYHGENDVTRFASSTTGIDFEYEGAPVTADMFDRISEASYARVFRYALPGRANRYIMLFMGNHEGTRNIYLAWSNDGRTWEPRRTPLLTPPPGTSQVAQAWYFLWQGQHYLIYHAHQAGNETYASLHVSEVDPAFEHTKHLGIFYDRTSVSPGNVAQMSPCLITEDGQRLEDISRVEGVSPSNRGQDARDTVAFSEGSEDAGGTPATRNRLYLFTNIGPRLNQKIALAIADIPVSE